LRRNKCIKPIKQSNKRVGVYVQNALKLIYEHLYFQNFPGGYTPGPPVYKNGEGQKGKKGKKGRGGCVMTVGGIDAPV